MRTNATVKTLAATVMLASFPALTHGQPHVSFQLEFGAPAASGFYLSLGREYGVPERDVFVMHEAGVLDEDMPVILYIYAHSHYSLRQIYSLRLRGATWQQLSNWCGVPLYRERGGPPYGNAYGYYRNGPGKTWGGRGGWEGEGHGKKWWKEGGGRGRAARNR